MRPALVAAGLWSIAIAGALTIDRFTAAIDDLVAAQVPAASPQASGAAANEVPENDSEAELYLVSDSPHHSTLADHSELAAIFAATALSLPIAMPEDGHSRDDFTDVSGERGAEKNSENGSPYVVPVPEPEPFTLVLLGLIAFAGCRSRTRRAHFADPGAAN